MNADGGEERPICISIIFLLEVCMAGSIDDAEIELQCENCGGKTKKSMAWIKDNDQFACACGTLIPVDASKFRKELVKTESELDGFQGLMEKLGK
jgi:hypothetical protein